MGFEKFERQASTISYVSDCDDMLAAAASPWNPGYTMSHLPSASSRHSSVGGAVQAHGGHSAYALSSSQSGASLTSQQFIQRPQSLQLMGRTSPGMGNIASLVQGPVGVKSHKTNSSGWPGSFETRTATLESTPVRGPPQAHAFQPSGRGPQFSGAPLSPHSSDRSTEIDRKDETIAELKVQIESLVAAMAMSTNSATPDGMEMAHRMLTRLRTLRNENSRLSRLVSGNHAAELEAENARLKRENSDLKHQLYATNGPNA